MLFIEYELNDKPFFFDFFAHNSNENVPPDELKCCSVFDSRVFGFNLRNFTTVPDTFKVKTSEQICFCAVRMTER